MSNRVKKNERCNVVCQFRHAIPVVVAPARWWREGSVPFLALCPPSEPLGERLLVSRRRRLVPLGAAQRVRQVFLSRGVAAFGMIVAIVRAVADVLHEPRSVHCGCAAARAPPDIRAPRVAPRPTRRRRLFDFGASREIDDRLCDRELALGRAQKVVGVFRGERDRQRTRVGEPDVLGRHPHDAPRDVEDGPRRPRPCARTSTARLRRRCRARLCAARRSGCSAARRLLSYCASRRSSTAATVSGPTAGVGRGRAAFARRGARAAPRSR